MLSFWSQRKSSLGSLSDICYLSTFGTRPDILDSKHLIKEEKILSVWLFVTFLQHRDSSWVVRRVSQMLNIPTKSSVLINNARRLSVEWNILWSVWTYALRLHKGVENYLNGHGKCYDMNVIRGSHTMLASHWLVTLNTGLWLVDNSRPLVYGVTLIAGRQ